jgi:hypothetical protein
VVARFINISDVFLLCTVSKQELQQMSQFASLTQHAAYGWYRFMTTNSLTQQSSLYREIGAGMLTLPVATSLIFGLVQTSSGM